MSPEVFACTQLGGNTYDGKASDIWACGVMLLTLLRGAYPFQGRDTSPHEAFQRGRELAETNQLQGHLTALVDQLTDVSPACKAVLHSMFRAEAAARPTAAALLQEPWFVAAVAEMPDMSAWHASPPAQTKEEILGILAQQEDDM